MQTSVCDTYVCVPNLCKSVLTSQTLPKHCPHSHKHISSPRGVTRPRLQGPTKPAIRPELCVEGATGTLDLLAHVALGPFGPAGREAQASPPVCVTRQPPSLSQPRHPSPHPCQEDAGPATCNTAVCVSPSQPRHLYATPDTTAGPATCTAAVCASCVGVEWMGPAQTQPGGGTLLTADAGSCCRRERCQLA